MNATILKKIAWLGVLLITLLLFNGCARVLHTLARQKYQPPPYQPLPPPEQPFPAPEWSDSARAQQATNNGRAIARAIRGSVYYYQAGQWHPLKVGKALGSGAMIQTMANSEVDLFLKQNGPVVRLVGSSQLAIERLAFDDAQAEMVIYTKLDLLSGRLLGHTKKMSARSRYEITTPKGLHRVDGIESSDYDVCADGVVHVLTGTIQSECIDASGNASFLTVKKGYSFYPASGGKPPRIEKTPPEIFSPRYTGIIAPYRSHEELSVMQLPPAFNQTSRYSVQNMPGIQQMQPRAKGQISPMMRRDSASLEALAAAPGSLPSLEEEIWVIARPADAPIAEATDTPGSGAMLAKSADTLEEVPLPLKHTEVKAFVSGYIASVEVAQQFHNPYENKIEAVYVFPLPHNAAVNEFIMVIGERRIRGIIRERQEAEQIYQAAKSQGYTASLLTQERPNVFTQSVANIEPGKQIDVCVKYFHTLAYNDGWYEFVFPMVVGPRFNPPGWTNGIGAVAMGTTGSSGQKIETQHLKPSQRGGHDIALSIEIDAGVEIEDLECRSHVVDIKETTPERWYVALSQNDRIPNKDFVLRYKVAGQQIKSNLLAHQDDRGGFFTLMLYPPDSVRTLNRQPLEMVFVLDCSGSMHGRPLAQAKAAIERTLRKLKPDDTFQIIRFSNDASQLGPRPLAASPENVRQGLQYVSGLNSQGGTMMIEGIKAALDFPHDERRLRFVTFLTDGYIGNEIQILAAIQQRLGASRIFSFGVGSSVNRYLLEHMAKEGRGAVAYLGLNDSPVDVIDKLFDRIRHPAITDIEIDWGQLQVAELFPRRVPDLFVGRPVILTGRFKGETDSVIRIFGKASDQPVQIQIPVAEMSPDTPQRALACVWARMKIADLMSQSLHNATEDLAGQIKQVALDYGLMSAYTAFVAVDSTRQTKGESYTTVPVALPMPEGVNYNTTVQEK